MMTQNIDVTGQKYVKCTDIAHGVAQQDQVTINYK